MEHWQMARDIHGNGDIFETIRKIRQGGEDIIPYWRIAQNNLNACTKAWRNCTCNEEQRPDSVGADADITIFDPERILDQATYEEPAKYSIGINYVWLMELL